VEIYRGKKLTLLRISGRRYTVQYSIVFGQCSDHNICGLTTNVYRFFALFSGAVLTQCVHQHAFRKALIVTDSCLTTKMENAANIQETNLLFSTIWKEVEIVCIYYIYIYMHVKIY
jgi:hypothetical protein